MTKSFDLIGAPFNLLGCHTTADNTVDALRRLDEESWQGLSHWMEVRNARWNADIRDKGDVKINTQERNLIELKEKEQGLALYAGRLKQLLLSSYQQKRIPITIGGDHSIAIGTVQAALEYYQKQQKQRVAVVWIDAHADCNDALASNLHGKPVAMLMDKYSHNGWQVDASLVLNPQDVYYVAVRDLMPNEHQLMTENQMVNFDHHYIERHGIAAVVESIKRIVDQHYDCLYVSFDYDALDGALYRACATPNQGGLSAREAHYLIYELAQHDKFIGIDFVEYLPELDTDGLSKELMIKLIDAVWGYRA